MKISIIASAHRTELWKDFYDSIITNIDFEVIFVSDREPTEEEQAYLKLRPKFKYIISQVKPAQCFEIAYRQSTGDFVIWTGDDFIYSPYAFDHVVNMYKSMHDYRAMISFTNYENGDKVIQNHRVPWDESKLIQLSTSALISKQAIEEAGGLADINFVAGHWDVDLMMRIYALGGNVHVCPTAISYEPHLLFHKSESNFALTWREELDYFTHLWCKDGKTVWERQEVFQPYINENLLTLSQGKTGKWK